jgi:hypothetical protein
MKDLLQANSRLRWYQHPLLHFALFGVAAFGIQAYFSPAEEQPGIVVSDALVAELGSEFEQQNGHAPSPEEEAALLNNWVEEEMLFREALALELDRGDAAVRNRLVTKLRSIMSDLEGVAEPTTEDLQAIIDADPQHWTLPARIDFEHIFFRQAPAAPAEGSEAPEPGASATVRAIATLRALRAGEDPTDTGDPYPAGAEFEERAPVQITQTFGARFSRELNELDLNEWSGPVRSDSGLHIVRVTQRHEPRLATVDDSSRRLVAAWRVEHAERSQQLFMTQLRERYAVQDLTGLLAEGSE